MFKSTNYPKHTDTVSDDENDSEPDSSSVGETEHLLQLMLMQHSEGPYFLLHLMTYRVQSGILINSWTNLSLSGMLNNLYALMKNAPEMKTTVHEIDQFIGTHTIMTVVSMPSYRIYWQKTTRYESVAGVMSRKRFDQAEGRARF